DELLRIEAWGNNSLRIRAFPTGIVEEHVNALTEPVPNPHCKVIIHENGNQEIRNGKISAIIDHRNKISFFNEKGALILQEFIRLRAVKHDDGSEDI
ncbi:glycoside hydrolase family 31 protein, partial [Streptococcus suis]|nr:glycoside hydrolase family 31 protein [Streptococcus suis]